MDVNDTVLTVTDQDFAEQVLQAPLPVIVDFTASWCPPCRALAPVFENLSQTYAGKLRFARMDTDENLQTPLRKLVFPRFQMKPIPTLNGMHVFLMAFRKVCNDWS